MKNALVRVALAATNNAVGPVLAGLVLAALAASGV